MEYWNEWFVTGNPLCPHCRHTAYVSIFRKYTVSRSPSQSLSHQWISVKSLSAPFLYLPRSLKSYYHCLSAVEVGINGMTFLFFSPSWVRLPLTLRLRGNYYLYNNECWQLFTVLKCHQKQIMFYALDRFVQADVFKEISIFHIHVLDLTVHQVIMFFRLCNSVS